MGSLTKVLCVILFISLMVFVTFFGRIPALRRTPIATLYKLIWINLPNGLTRADQAVTGGRVSSYLSRFNNLMLYERHWTVVLFFLLIMVVGECLFVPQAWPQVGATTKVAVVITISLPYIFLYLACAVDPGYITPENHAYHMSLYPYDHTVFHPGHMCKTCGFLKPPRSKHCSLCKRCIAKADHHCVFINSCVGYGNQHWFILLLASTSFLCTYGGILGMSLITVRVQRYIPGWSVWKPSHMTINKYLAGWGWGIEDNVNMGASSLLAALTSPLVWGLFFYTLYLVYCGTTTNETLKWSDWKEEMREGFAFRRSMSPFRLRNEQIEPPCPRWPLEVKQIIVTTQDGQPPKNDRLPGEGQWERVWNLSDVENLYDMGFWDNMVDIFVPDYTYGQRIDEPNAERRRGR